MRSEVLEGEVDRAEHVLPNRLFGVIHVRDLLLEVVEVTGLA